MASFAGVSLTPFNVAAVAAPDRVLVVTVAVEEGIAGQNSTIGPELRNRDKGNDSMAGLLS